MDEKNMMIGIDLNQEYSRICYYDRTKRDAVPVDVQVGSGKTAFPTALAYIPSTKEWFVGIEAAYFARQKNGVLIDHLYSLCSDGNKFDFEGASFKAEELLSIFIKKSLLFLGIKEPRLSIQGMVITVPMLNRGLVQALHKALEILGISGGRAFLQDYRESFYYHTLYQKQELWMRRCGLFSFRDRMVTYYSMELNRRTKPVTAVVAEGNTIELPLDESLRDAAFLQLIKESLQDEIFSSLFIAGQGFSREWATESTNLLCRKQRKVFGEEALYAKGACYAAREKVEERSLRGYLYFSSDMIRYNIGIDLLINGTPAHYSLISAGMNWYDTGKTIELLMDDTDELIFTVSRMDTKEKKFYSMKLKGLPKRPLKATKLRVKMAFESASRCLVKVEDLGLGEIFPSSNLTWEEILEG